MADGTSPDQSRSDAVASPKSDTVPAPAVRRLSLYLRELELLLEQNKKTISSRQLGKTLGLTDAQVRKDLAYFGQFGHPGVGYRVDELIVRLRRIFGTDRTWNALLVGVGNLGQALLSYRGFAKQGFRIVAVFDNHPSKIGQRVEAESECEIFPMDQLAEVIFERDIQMAIVTVPANVAQSVIDVLVAAGIKGILNFAPAAISVPDHVSMATVDLAIRLEQLAFRISTNQVAREQ